MTRVEITYLNDGCMLECRGHAGYAEKGRDVVCAGVSALCIALLERLDALAAENLATVENSYVADGELSVEISYAQDRLARMLTQATVETVAAGLRRLAELYPANVTVEET